jgi:hypothetical protein
MKIIDEPAFAWWAPYMLRKRDQIISAINTCCKRRTHKFGIEVPTSVQHTLEIDKETQTLYWHDAIQKEMGNVQVAFEFLAPGESVPIGTPH